MVQAAVDDLKEFIRAALVEPPGQLTKELIKLCEGLIAIEPESKSVRIVAGKLTEKERVALICLGHWILSYMVDSPSLSEVPLPTLEKVLAINVKAISAYASVLVKDRILSKSTRGTYQARLAKMPEFLRGVRRKLGGSESS